LLVVDSAYPNEWVTFLPIMLLSAVFMLLLYLVLLKFLQPISLMQSRIISLEEGDLDSKIVVRGEDELALLSQNFNRLIAEIKHLLNQKERLLSDVSHELKTPLAKIRLLIALVKPEDKIQKIDKHVDYLDSIITNILISDKLATPYTNLDIEETTVKKLIGQAVELSKNKNIEYLALNTSVIKCDTIKMAIVIKNLLDNAEKYAASNRAVEIDSSVSKQVVYISVRDYGPGIDSKLIKDITKPYVRGKNLKQPGFGLGLSICKKVMESHGGILKITNMPDRGCCFTISWNCHKL
jgi:signal transduction histidine kinase